MAQHSVEHQGTRIKLAYLAFGISQTCYRYQAKQSAENVEIADHLIRRTHNQRDWGFGLCFRKRPAAPPCQTSFGAVNA